MRTSLRYRCAVLIVLCLAGCGQPVREDRSIHWSSEGKSVGFQHGREGVFVADADGRALTKVFQPDAGVIATSTPLWSPTGTRAIFTTARSARGQRPLSLPGLGGATDPAGGIHHEHEIVYTCWLFEQTADGKTTPPVALFEARADHPGYVAANLAVRWHPRLNRVEYVHQAAAGQHALMEFDLGAQQSRQVFPHSAEALVFDWTPDGSRLACVLGSRGRNQRDGIWVGRPDDADWWHVPGSGGLALGEFGSLLENLRAARPAWTRDGSRFAFPAVEPGPPKQPPRHVLYHAALVGRVVERWAGGDRPFRDLRWDNRDLRLGVVQGGEDGSLHLLRRGQPPSPPISRAPVRRFAGWDAAGDRLAYVVPDDLPLAAGGPWALLLLGDAWARDRVYVAAGDGTEPGRQLFAGMRVTFPQWSPREEKLSLWVTFTPAYRSVISHLLGWGLRPGDPAAVFDLTTGRLGWMPVNAHEKVQVGHYHLLKRNYAEAWRWYEEAERELPEPAPVVANDFMAYVRAIEGPRDFSLFQYQCLMRLGRADEARAKLDRFRRLFPPRFAESAADPLLPPGFRDLLNPGGMLGELLQDLYAAEVFLSLDAVEDGEAFFRAALADTRSDASRLSRGIVLGQLLLLRKKHDEYATVSTDVGAPLVLSMLKAARAADRRDAFDAAAVTEMVGVLALLPLGVPEFLARLPNEQLGELRRRWEKLRAGAGGANPILPHLVLHGLYQALGRERERQQAAGHLKLARPGSHWPLLEGDPGQAIEKLYAELHRMLRQW